MRRTESARCLKPAGAEDGPRANLVKGEKDMKKFNLKNIMLRAWKLYRNGKLSFAECLHRAWLSEKVLEINAERIERAKIAAGVTEETNTWSEWKKLGYEVIHGSKALFGCDLIWGSRGDGQIYKARFFGKSQVEAIA